MRFAPLTLRTVLVLGVPALVPALVACTHDQASQTPAAEYDARGVVRAIDRATRSITIQHEDVPGYMPAMTMPFEVSDLAVLDGLAIGDRVTFRFAAEAGGRHVVRSIHKQ